MRGREMLEQELKRNNVSLDDVADDEIMLPIIKRLSFATMDDLYAAIGYGGLASVRAANRIKDELSRIARPDKRTAIEKMSDAAERREQQAARERKAVHGILVDGLDNCLIKFSRCCTPVPGDDIVGFITRGQGVSNHRKDCENYLNRKRSSEDDARWIGVSWASQITDSYVTTLKIVSRDRAGLVMDIATMLNSINAKVRSLSARDNQGTALVSLTLEVKSLNDLKYVMGRLNNISGVSSVERNG